MRPAMLQLMTTTTFLVSCIAVNEGLLPNFHMQLIGEDLIDELCPPCEYFFPKLEPTGKNGKLTQVTKVQERGEPKSGTVLMYDWASGTLLWTFHYLQQLYGEESCRLFFTEEDDSGQDMGRNANRTMIFEPALGGSGSRCTCDTIDKVTIVLSRYNKHALPVELSFAYSHRFMIQSALVQNTRNPGILACNFADGTNVTNYDELSQCMHAGSCDIVDDWLQMSVLRDPRPAIVSIYFRLQVLNGPNLQPLEAFVARELPILCQWLAIRYILFSDIIPHQSMEVWYTDAIQNPLEWHYNWFDYIGLQLPHGVVEATAKAAAANNFGFFRMAVEVHQGEQAWIEAGHRRFDDYVIKEVAAAAATVLRTWLPPVLLQRFGVTPWE